MHVRLPQETGKKRENNSEDDPEPEVCRSPEEVVVPKDRRGEPAGRDRGVNALRMMWLVPAVF